MIEEIGRSGESQVYRVERGIYLVRLAGHLSAAASEAMQELIRRDQPNGKRAVLYETTREFTGYDPELRSVKTNPALKGTAHIAIITSNPLLRMVTATLAITLRTLSGVPMASYGSVENAVDGARKALAR